MVRVQEAEPGGPDATPSSRSRPGPRLGNVGLEIDGLEKDYGDKVLFKGLSFKLPPNGIVGVIGPNGAGKSTPVSRSSPARRRPTPARCGSARR